MGLNKGIGCVNKSIRVLSSSEGGVARTWATAHLGVQVMRWMMPTWVLTLKVDADAVEDPDWMPRTM